MKFRYLYLLLLLSITQYHCSSSFEVNKSDSNIYGLSSSQYKYIAEQTQKGGYLDYESNFGKDGLVIIGDIAYNKRDAALYTWGRTMKKFGLPNSDKAIALYEEIRNVTLTEYNQKALRNGFNAKD